MGSELPAVADLSPPPARPAAPRLEYIDGLRALAALWVAVHHVFETTPPTRLLGTSIVGPIVASLNFGQFPVMVFLMLSGFCLYYPYVRKNPSGPTFSGFRTYLSRRWTRIAPPYLWTCAFCLVMAQFPQLQVGRWVQTTPIDAATIATHLLFIHNLSPLYSVKIDYPMWSIGLEFQLYLLFPLLVGAFLRTRGLLVTLGCLVLAAVVRATYHHLPEVVGTAMREGPFSYLEIFAAGMLVAALTVRGEYRIAPPWVLTGVILAGLVVLRLGSGNGLTHDLATSAAAFCTLLLAANPSGRMRSVLSTPWLVQIGVFSYSFYLVHAPLEHLFWFALRPLGLSPDAYFAVLAIVCMPAILGLSYGFHVLFERPFMRVAGGGERVRAGGNT
jgi:peptidoglycan/LPS O-acetylase OafA/YrhL